MEVADEGIMFGGHSGTRVRVHRCDVRAIPQFIPLVDQGGVTYPFRVTLDAEDQQVALQSDMVGAVQRSGKQRSQTEVVTFGDPKGHSGVWKRKVCLESGDRQVAKEPQLLCIGK